MSSKIKVDTIENVAGSGNVSLGSGHNLVVPGNQTVGGTFGVTGASTLTGDTQVTGNLGVGVAPERKFHVEGSGAEFSLVDTSRPTDKKTINMFIDANGKGNIRMLNDAQNAGNTAIVIEGSSPHTSPVVTKPYQPFFFAKPTASGDGQTRNPYKFENVTHNIGGHFVTSGTGAHERFVAPVAGNYYFATMPGYLQAGVNHATRIAVNGSEMSELSRFIQGSAGSHCAFGASIMLRLAANDYVTIHPQYTPYHLNTNTCYFCGMLVG